MLSIGRKKLSKLTISTRLLHFISIKFEAWEEAIRTRFASAMCSGILAI